MNSTYEKAGVSLKSGEEVVNRIKSIAKSTFSPNVLTGIGHFGAFYELDLQGYNNPVLVSSVDGVGTKLKIAIKMNKHNTIGQDLVNHCVNDIAVCGATPLYFMDYLAFGKLELSIAEEIIQGFAIAAKQNKVSLIGGETAEMPGLYSKKDYDISGTIIGIVEKDEILDGSKVQKSDVLIGFPSSGLHTNGYSLAREVLLKKYDINDKPDNLENSIGNELLTVHKSYLSLIKKLISENLVNAFSHITGGGILGNTKRVVPKGFNITIDWKAWEIPEIFKLIQLTGNISDNEMRNVFNIGIGLVAIANKDNAKRILAVSSNLNEKAFIIGEII